LINQTILSVWSRWIDDARSVSRLDGREIVDWQSA
jgi:hypothetical protein